MNNNRPSDVDHRSLQILDELSNNDSLTQRDLSSRLGIALGLVNTYIKNLVKKGYITVRAIPPKRYTYYLTPKGFTEKTRLTYHLLQDYTRIYREARSSVKKLFQNMEKEGMKKVVFAGADEVAEIAYITLQESGMDLVGVVDEERTGNKFFGKKVQPIRDIQTMQHDCIVVTSYLHGEEIYKHLLMTGIKKDSIKRLFV
ncbi:MAG TPA: winged helix-turn-helix transcriptional regulator [Nitrospirota bacterium]|nr:winged helix-turn-helix transcriptional regulator [Nitrospirota bacterium]